MHTTQLRDWVARRSGAGITIVGKPAGGAGETRQIHTSEIRCTFGNALEVTSDQGEVIELVTR